MRIVDPHHHLWDRQRYRYPWLAEPVVSGIVGDTTPLCRDYLVADFVADHGELEVARSVHIQAEIAHDLSVEETRWLQSLADAGPGYPHGIVAYADLSAADVDAVLAAHCQSPNLRGIRQILNIHSDPIKTFVTRDYMAEEAWQRGLGLLAGYGLSFDMQLYWPQMAQGAATARRHAGTQIVVNHTGMPMDRDADGIAGWRNGMRTLASCPNVAVKISGLGMTDHHWTTDSIRPFVLETIEIFGPDRCLFASNFPVDKLFGSYAAVWAAYDEITRGCTADERAGLFHANAVRVYRL